MANHETMTQAERSVAEEIEKLKATQKKVRGLQSRLDAMRAAAAQFAQAADEFITGQGSSRKWLTRNMGITHAEATLVWPPHTSKDHGTASATPNQNDRAMPEV